MARRSGNRGGHQPARNQETRGTDAGYVDPHLQDDDHAEPPVRTTPQGTQFYAVEHGHEERDVDVPVLIRWFFYVAALSIGASVVLVFGMQLLAARERATQAPLSALRQIQVDPPLPRLIPNPTDERGREGLPQVGPIEYHLAFKQAENEQLQALGLYDMEAKSMVLPENAAQAVQSLNGGAAATAGAAAGDQVQWIMPSDASGGLGNEDRLR